MKIRKITPGKIVKGRFIPLAKKKTKKRKANRKRKAAKKKK